jgi:AcrR family transcriptional regulator
VNIYLSMSRSQTVKRKTNPHMEKNTREGKQRKRLSPQLRRAQIMDAAAQLIVKQGYLPLSVEALAKAANASKALVYTYFATQYDLFNGLLQREIEALATAGVETASRVKDLEQAAVLCGVLYFDHVAQRGPLIHILLTDLYMEEHIDAEATRVGLAILRRLVRLASATFKMSKKEIMAAIEMIAAIPEEAGSLSYQKELDVATARQLCHSLLLSSLQALRSPGRVTVSPDDAL